MNIIHFKNDIVGEDSGIYFYKIFVPNGIFLAFDDPPFNNSRSEQLYD